MTDYVYLLQRGKITRYFNYLQTPRPTHTNAEPREESTQNVEPQTYRSAPPSLTKGSATPRTQSVRGRVKGHGSNLSQRPFTSIEETFPPRIREPLLGSSLTLSSWSGNPGGTLGTPPLSSPVRSPKSGQLPPSVVSSRSRSVAGCRSSAWPV